MAKTQKDDLDIEIKANIKDKEEWKQWYKSQKGKGKGSGGAGGAVYCLGIIGSLVYWMQAAVGFGAVVTGILKSLVWPAYIVYKLLESFYGIAN